MSEIELLTVGRNVVDLYAEQLRTPLRQVESFRKSVGGTATNVAVAAARLGHRAALLTRVGDDPMGDYMRWALEHTFGVDTRFVAVDPERRTSRTRPIRWPSRCACAVRVAGRYPNPVATSASVTCQGWRRFSRAMRVSVLRLL